MSQTMTPIGNNVVPFPPNPGASPLMGGQPQNTVPNPAFAAWLQQAQAVQQAQQENMRRQAQFDAAVALIKKDGIHGFKLDIEADSTIAPDEQAEKQARVEFLQQMIPMLDQVVPIAQGNPPLAALAKEMTLFAVRGFRVARPLEEAFEQAFDAIAKMPPNPKFSGQDKAHSGAAPQNPQLEAAKVAVQAHDTDQKAQTERMAIAQKGQQAQVEAGIAQQRAAAEDHHTQAELMLAAAELQQRERLEQARVTALGARQIQGLT